MLTAHDLLLLLLDDETGRITPGLPEPDKAMAGAVLVDLAVRGLADVTEKGRLVVLPAEPPAEPVLQRGLAVIQEYEGSKPEAVLGRLAKGLRDQLAGELVDGGILRREEHKVMGLFRTNRLPANNNSYENEMRSRISRVLSGAQPDARSGPLIALLHAMNAVTSVLVVSDEKEAKRKAKEIAQGDWAAAAVRKAVQAMQAAVITSVIVASAATSS